MKSATKLIQTLASVLLCLAATSPASYAATKNPILGPQGIALDAKGNLYVANSGGNDILVYSPSYAQMTTKTITQNIANPTNVAFDSQGNLWVTTAAPTNGTPYGSVAEYINGTQNVSATITNNIQYPTAIAVDGIGDVWVVNNNSYITVYGPSGAYGPPTQLIRTFNPTPPIYGLAIGKGTLAWGNSGAVSIVAESPTLTYGAEDGFGWSNDDGVGIASDANGNFYISNLDGTVNVSTPTEQYNLGQIGFGAVGVAVDSVRGRVYFSSYSQNTIVVYSTKGQYLTTIK